MTAGSAIKEIQRDFRKLASPSKAGTLQRFFKTGPGQYGEGDQFLGIVVPKIRRFVKKHPHLPLATIQIFIRSPFHEERLLALLSLVTQYQKASPEKVTAIFRFYVKYRKFINNWDLVDLTTPAIVGHYLTERNKSILYRFAQSKDLWERRMAILATFHWIRMCRFHETLCIARILLNDPHDLIHKAVGWMLREIGKRNQTVLESFLKPNYPKMPRTMLRYAIERFPESRRQAYLKGKVHR